MYLNKSLKPQTDRQPAIDFSWGNFYCECYNSTDNLFKNTDNFSAPII
jgi:hypothetical protein